MLIQHGTVFAPSGFENDRCLIVAGDRIREIVDAAPAQASGERVVDASGYFVVPGFVDVHVHGAAGSDTMDATPEALATMARFFASHGVTSFLATTMSASRAATLAAVRNVASYAAVAGGAGAYVAGARAAGVHLEGPFVSPAARGAQPGAYCRPPDVDELAELVAAGPVRLITLAPELPGAEAVICAATGQGVRVAVGHTTASYDEIRAAVDWGASHATHTYNAMTGLHHRKPGAVGAILTDERLLAELIADGVHVHPAVIALTVRAKGTARVALVTDAMRATGLPDGVYDLGGQDVVVENGSCWLADAAGHATSTLAGSTLTMDAAVRNTMQATGLPLAAVLPMATSVPALEAGLGREAGQIAAGALADVVLLDKDYQVAMTVVAGEVVYER